MIHCNVAVTGINSADDPQPGIGVIRALRDSGQWQGKIIALAYDALDSGIYARNLIDEAYLIAYPFDRAGLLERLKSITRRTKIDVLMPLLDLELLTYPTMEPQMKEMGINCLLPTPSKIRLHLKLNLAGFCLHNNIAYPRQIPITSSDSIAYCFGVLGTPVVVKGTVHGSHLATNVNEAVGHFNAIKNRWGLPIIMQEYIEGEEYNADCLVDRDGTIVGSVAMRKLAVTEKGKAWSGVTVIDDKLINLSQDIVKKLDWIGPVEFEFVKQRTSGRHYLLEINPRFGAWIYLAAQAGQNMPLAAVQIAMGEKVRALPPYKPGLMFVRHSMDVICPIDSLAKLTMEGELILNGAKAEGVSLHAQSKPGK